MDDFAHLLVGYSIWRIAMLAGFKEGKWLALALALAGSILPDLLWPWGFLSYSQTHTMTYYIMAALLLLAWGKTRNAGALFMIAACAHIAIDIPMHTAVYAPLYPIMGTTFQGTFNYWTDIDYMIGYWIAVLALVGATFIAEWKLTGKMTLGCDGKR